MERIEYPEDVARIRVALQAEGIELTDHQIQDAWVARSEADFATWLSLPADDAAIFRAIRPHLPVKVGDRVRSYDFPDRVDCYVEGVVEEIGAFPEFPGCERYRIKVDRAVFEGKPNGHFADFVFPPVNGTRTSMGRVCDGVVPIQPALTSMRDIQAREVFCVMTDFEQTADQAPTLEEARIKARALFEHEPLVVNVSIHNAAGDLIEDLGRTPGCHEEG